MKQIHLTNEGIVLQTKSAGLIKKAEGQFIPFVDGFESSQMTIDIRLKRITVETGHTTFPSKKVHEFGLAYAKGNFPIKPSKSQMRISFENGRISLKVKKDEVSFPMNQIDFIRISKGEITLLNRRMAVLKKIAV